MTSHKFGTHEEWLAARLELLEAEKELTRRSDKVALQRRELLQCFEPFEPQLLADRQHVPVVNESGARSRKRAAHGHGAVLA